MLDSKEDLIACAQLAMENPNCSLIAVANTIRDLLGWRPARQSLADAAWALRQEGSPRAIAIISSYHNR